MVVMRELLLVIDWFLTVAANDAGHVELIVGLAEAELLGLVLAALELALAGTHLSNVALDGLGDFLLIRHLLFSLFQRSSAPRLLRRTINSSTHRVGSLVRVVILFCGAQ